MLLAPLQRKQADARAYSAVSEKYGRTFSAAGFRARTIYRCMKGRDGSEYYHLVAATDDQAIKVLQERDFFARYTEQTKLVAGGAVDVLPLETIAETSYRA